MQLTEDLIDRTIRSMHGGAYRGSLLSRSNYYGGATVAGGISWTRVVVLLILFLVLRGLWRYYRYNDMTEEDDVCGACAKGPGPISKSENWGYGQEEPLNKDTLGRASWTFLHATASRYPLRPSAQDKTYMKHLLDSIGHFYPCDMCKRHFREYLQESPPDLESRESLCMWLCRVHNNVNKSLGKPQFDCRRCIERWQF